MTRYRFAIVGAVLALAAPAWGQTPSTVRLSVGSANALVSAGNPLPVTATITPSGTQDVNLTKILGAAPSATNPIWVSPATASTPWTVGGAAASGAALSGNPVRVGLSDGTNAQNWLAAIALLDGVNGNNTGAVAGWVWNGTTWDRMPGTTAGVTVRNPTAANLNATVVGTGTFVTQSAVTAASGSYASGAFASGSFASGSHAAGSFASGAFASGSVASGAYASGSLASGAMVDLVALSAPVAPATATATKSALIGCQATSAGINPTTGQQAALDCDLNNNLLVSSGGAPNLSISQVSVATSDTAVVSARALRRSVTIQQITGTQNVFCNQTTATAANGVVLPAVVGASVTLNTTSAVRCIAISGAQTVAVAETF